MHAARLRTLPLSVSGIITGTALANFLDYNDLGIFLLALITTIGFQITSNIANDYGDGVKGTDNDQRIGPKRAYQSGILSRKELKSGTVICAMASLILAFVLVTIAFGRQHLFYVLLFGMLAVGSVWAAIKYTVGDSAYGYKGLGDVFVFVFFGLLGVVGSFFLYTKFLTFSALLPAISIGSLCTAVLNLNNLRDYDTDKGSGKITLVVRMGYPKGKKYHVLLIVSAFLSFFIFVALHWDNAIRGLPLIAFVPIFAHMRRVQRIQDKSSLDPELKKLALSTFFLSLLFYLSSNIFL